MTSNRTISCKQASALAIGTTSKENGTRVGSARWELSPDEQTLTIKAVLFQTDGSVKSKETVYSRISPSVGFAGGWRNANRLASRPELLLSLKDQRLHIAFPETGQYTDPPLDGSDAAILGPGVMVGLTMAVSPRDPYQFLTLKKFKGQVINQGSLTLATDGRTLVEEYWRPDRPDEKAVLVYERE